MPSPHKHSDDDHIFKLCYTCGVVWCNDCSREWGTHQPTYTHEWYPLTNGQSSASTTTSTHNDSIAYGMVATIAQHDHSN